MFRFGIVVTGSPPMILRRMLISEWGQCRRKEMKEKEIGVLSQFIFLHPLFQQI